MCWELLWGLSIPPAISCTSTGTVNVLLSKFCLSSCDIIPKSELCEPFHGCGEDITLLCGAVVVIKVIKQ